MFCEHCGTKIEESYKFCTKCGHSTFVVNEKEKKLTTDEKWWHRLVKVVYITLYVPLPIILVAVWIENSPSYSSYYGRYSGSTGEAFWYSLFTLIIYIIAIRLIKIVFLYIVHGRKPEWRKEFKKIV
jgi:hypothetical protein